MKEATGELNMTLVTIIAIAAVLTFVVAFLPGILGSIGDKWDDTTGSDCVTNPETKQVCCTQSDGTQVCHNQGE